ncbi:ABC-type transport auxiliary lipoprotein family protein [Litorimonas sp. RW-G-Af-16]|uniref:ABC-type transport auxiliary lipoprotein family protein n=1 Tax=Litorimonas sp. RW-G-Af-16 TaxID=3241168 RepID=UPI00390CD222
MMTSLRFLGAGVLGLGLSGCISLLPEPAPAPSIYRLSTAEVASAAEPNAEIIRVDRPASSTYFESKDIVVSPDGSRLATASGAEWAEVTPIMVQDALISAMSASPKLIGVLPSSGARTQTRVHLTIKNFEAQFDQGEERAPLAIVRYDVTFSNASDRTLLGTFSTRQTQRADAVRVSAIVEAIEGANKAAMSDIIAWLEGEVAS